MINKLINFIINSPLYPHWLEWKKSDQANKYILKSLKDKVVEVGAGDGSMKVKLLKNHRNIIEYTSTDLEDWDSEFENIDKKIKKMRLISQILGYRQRIKPDKICKAEKLPFKDNSFDYHLSFEVLEHVEDPDKYFKEAKRVLKQSGKIILSIPFLYRMHGGEPDHKLDYQRFTNGYFYKIARKYNLKILNIYSNTGFGTTFASLTNQWIIQKIKDSKMVLKMLIILLSPIIFLFTNTIGLLIDQQPDKRFATRFYIIFEKL